ncbi:MAG: PriCT-2 domain-containing protein [Candidatus Cloacimonadaceae bacterium]|nr:PriCT-2 domain-containing protein [Candidatus Cloacimonadaceae bacterium]MDP3114546.1 PriCT-2 domain-containing protein [Candidatus Cloacimonadaceae bacterium]
MRDERKDLDSSLRWNDGCRACSPVHQFSILNLPFTGSPILNLPFTHSPKEEDYARAEGIVRQLAQIRMDYHDWIKLGMALYAGFGEGGKTLWDMFIDNPHYQDTQREIDKAWRGFRHTRSVTIASLFYIGEKYGC